MVARVYLLRSLACHLPRPNSFLAHPGSSRVRLQRRRSTPQPTPAQAFRLFRIADSTHQRCLHKVPVTSDETTLPMAAPTRLNRPARLTAWPLGPLARMSCLRPLANVPINNAANTYRPRATRRHVSSAAIFNLFRPLRAHRSVLALDLSRPSRLRIWDNGCLTTSAESMSHPGKFRLTRRGSLPPPPIQQNRLCWCKPLQPC